MQGFESSSVVTADYLTKTLLRMFKRTKITFVRIMRLAKAFKTDTLEKVAGELAAMNKPDLIDYRQIFCPEHIDAVPPPGRSNQDAAATCDFTI